MAVAVEEVLKGLVFVCIVWIAGGQRELIASRDADHDCWRPLMSEESEAQHLYEAYYVYVSEDEKTCYYLSTKREIFTKAEQRCVALADGAQLYSDATWAENQYFINTVAPSCENLLLGHNQDCSVWLGLQYNGTCTWKDGTPFHYFNWPRFVTDQCQQPHSDRYCISVDRTGAWNVDFCTKALVVLCEWRIVVPPSASALASAAAAKAVGIFFLILLLILLILFIIFILLGRFYFCRKIRDIHKIGVPCNSPDVEDPCTPDSEVEDHEDEDLLKEEPVDDISQEELHNYQTIPIRGQSEEPEKESDVETPLLVDNKPPVEAPGAPPVEETAQTYAIPEKSKKPKIPDPCDEIEILEKDVQT